MSKDKEIYIQREKKREKGGAIMKGGMGPSGRAWERTNMTLSVVFLCSRLVNLISVVFHLSFFLPSLTSLHFSSFHFSSLTPLALLFSFSFSFFSPQLHHKQPSCLLLDTQLAAGTTETQLNKQTPLSFSLSLSLSHLFSLLSLNFFFLLSDA